MLMIIGKAKVLKKTEMLELLINVKQLKNALIKKEDAFVMAVFGMVSQNVLIAKKVLILLSHYLNSLSKANGAVNLKLLIVMMLNSVFLTTKLIHYCSQDLINNVSVNLVSQFKLSMQLKKVKLLLALKISLYSLVKNLMNKENYQLLKLC